MKIIIKKVRNAATLSAMLMLASLCYGQEIANNITKVKDVVIYEDSLFYCAFPSVIKRPDGELFVAFRRAPNRKAFGESKYSHIDPNSYLVMVRSHDGETWTKEPELIYAHPFGGSQDPCLLQLRDGTLLCTSYGWAIIKPEGIENLKKPLFFAADATFLGGYLVRSTDGGKTWQGPIYPPHISPEINFSPFGHGLPAYNRGALYEGKNGRIYWAVAATDSENPVKISVHLLTSDDKGLTWTYQSPIAVDEKAGFNETSMYETPEGDLVAFLRTSNFGGQACIARSTDGGKSFKWESMGFRGHPLNALRLPDNRVLLTYGYRPLGIRARILNAECTDFAASEEFVLRDDGGNTDIGYTWPVQLDDNRVLVVYYFNKNDGIRHIAGTIIEIAPCCSGNTMQTLEWDEKAHDISAILHGIPVYDELNVVYRRNDKPLLNVEHQAPVVIAVASEPLRWGFFQFPIMYRNSNGLLVAQWNMIKDAASSYGKEGGKSYMFSSDNGKTWHSSDQPVPFGDGLMPYSLVFPTSGDRISIHTPVALQVSELQLPQPVATIGKNSIYRLSEIPAALQGVYLNRWDKNGVLSEIHAGLEDPGAGRYTTYDGLFPVVWWGDMKLLSDNSIIAGIYPMFYERESGGVDPSGISFYRSTDNGMNWKIWGKIPYSYDPTVDPNGEKRNFMGYTEPAFEILSDGTFLCVMRSDDGKQSPMYHSRSSDQGVTWSHPKAFTSNGVLPRLLQLDNGVLVLASGRPGVQIRFSIDGKGEKWTDPFEMLPPINTVTGWASCGYTDLLATGSDSFLVIYSDFKYLNEDNEERKAIKIREIKVTKR